MAVDAGATGRAKRPASVTVVAWLFVLEGLLLLLVGGWSLLDSGILLAPGGQMDPNPLRLARAATADDVTSTAFIVLGVLAFAVALGMFRLRTWAWYVGMTMLGLDLATALLDYFAGEPDYAAMVLSILIVLALNQQEVRQAFQVQEGV